MMEIKVTTQHVSGGYWQAHWRVKVYTRTGARIKHGDTGPFISEQSAYNACFTLAQDAAVELENKAKAEYAEARKRAYER